MAAHHKQTRAGLGRNQPIIHGICPGSTRHLILLALRGAGCMTSDQVYERFGGGTSGALHHLKAEGLVDMPPLGEKGKPVRLTTEGQRLTAYDGPLNRRTTLITYCQL